MGLQIQPLVMFRRFKCVTSRDLIRLQIPVLPTPTCSTQGKWNFPYFLEYIMFCLPVFHISHTLFLLRENLSVLCCCCFFFQFHLCESVLPSVKASFLYAPLQISLVGIYLFLCFVFAVDRSTFSHQTVSSLEAKNFPYLHTVTSPTHISLPAWHMVWLMKGAVRFLIQPIS